MQMLFFSVLWNEVTKADFDLDIDCIVKDASGQQMSTIRRRKGRKFELDTSNIKSGDIELCFSNHYSRFGEKHVYFSVTLDNKQGFNNINSETERTDEAEDSEDRILELKELFERTNYAGNIESRNNFCLKKYQLTIL